MSYKVEYKTHPTSSWTSVGTSYSENDAFNVASHKKSARPELIVRIVDTGTGSVVASF